MCAILASGCGMRPAPGAGTGGGSAGQGASRVDLSITIKGDGVLEHRVLRCNPDGGSYADPAAACRELLGVRHPFAPIGKGIMCPMILASGKTATITGTFDGRRIDATWPDGGCYLGRWQQFRAVFN